MFAFQQTGITPDVMALAKGLGSGMPIGACLAKGAAAEVFKPGNHGSTFGGNRLPALLRWQRWKRSRNKICASRPLKSRIHPRRLEQSTGRHGRRCPGTWCRADDRRRAGPSCGDLVKLALEQGLIINVTADSVVRLLPPLVMKREEAQQVVDMLAPLIKDFLAQK